MKEKQFPNGFTNWMETHHDVVEFITRNSDHSEIHRRRQLQGLGGLYELAEEWTDEFEKLHQGRGWDGDYFDELQDFLTEKNNL